MIDRCPVHGREFEMMSTRTIFGLPIPPSDRYLAARDKHFPHSRSFSFGGCLISDEPEAASTVEACPDCREAERLWETKHGQRY